MFSTKSIDNPPMLVLVEPKIDLSSRTRYNWKNPRAKTFVLAISAPISNLRKLIKRLQFSSLYDFDTNEWRVEKMFFKLSQESFEEFRIAPTE